MIYFSLPLKLSYLNDYYEKEDENENLNKDTTN
jgi:hypothetical protein